MNLFVKDAFSRIKKSPRPILPLLGFAIALSVALFATSAQAASGTDTMVGYWKLDETSGTSAADSSGDGNTGTHTNGPTISTTVPTTTFSNARSLSFDGVDDYVSVGNVLGFERTNAFSISVWVNRNATGTNHFIVSKQNSSLVGYSVFWDSANKIRVILRNSGINQIDKNISTADTTTGAWKHIVITYDGSSTAAGALIYVGGTSQATATNADTLSASIANSQNFEIGSRATGSLPFNGLIDDVRIYNRALSATEITALAAGNHTTATWTGTTNTNYETATNWDTGAVPDPYTNVVIADVTNDPISSFLIQNMATLFPGARFE